MIAFSEGLVEVSDTIEDLADNFKSYYDAFYSEYEKMHIMQSQMTESFAGIGMAMPKTREAFHGVMESLILPHSPVKKPMLHCY